MADRRSVVLHVGTHKTGTKTLQAFLIENRLALARGGIYVPAAGRHALSADAYSPGHHALAWDVLAGNLDQLRAMLDDLRKANAPTVVISSEDFQHLHARPAQALLMRDAFAALGYATSIVLYVRAQAPYLESLYAELTKTTLPPPFGTFLERALERGAVADVATDDISLTYAPLVLAFAGLFGAERIVVRPYLDAPDPRALVDDFLRVLSRVRGGLDVRDLRMSLPQANRRGTFGQVIARLLEHLPNVTPLVDDDVRAAPFAPLDRTDVLAILERFASDNAELETMAQIHISGTRADEIAPVDDARWPIARAQRAALDRFFS